MSQLVRLEGKQTTQTAHCAVLPPRPRSNFKIDKKNNINTDFDLETINTRITKPLLIICINIIACKKKFIQYANLSDYQIDY